MMSASARYRNAKPSFGCRLPRRRRRAVGAGLVRLPVARDSLGILPNRVAGPPAGEQCEGPCSTTPRAVAEERSVARARDRFAEGRRDFNVLRSVGTFLGIPLRRLRTPVVSAGPPYSRAGSHTSGKSPRSGSASGVRWRRAGVIVGPASRRRRRHLRQRVGRDLRAGWHSLPLSSRRLAPAATLVRRPVQGDACAAARRDQQLGLVVAAPAPTSRPFPASRTACGAPTAGSSKQPRRCGLSSALGSSVLVR